MFFLRKPATRSEPMPIRMSGVRMGERLLQVGIDGPDLAGAMAAKVGLSGTAAIVVNADAEDRARRAAAGAGALIDVHVAPFDALPFGESAFDVVVVHGLSGWLGALDAQRRTRALRDVHRVLRHGGRLILFEPGPREGLGRLLHAFTENAAYAASGGATAALESAGFKPVRLLAEREGYRFFEGLKTQPVG